MEYADQTSGAIRLYLTEGDFNVDQFLVLKKESLKWGQFNIEFGILGESHFVKFKYEDSTLSEICACTEILEPDNSKLIEYDFLPNLHNVPLTTKFLIFPYSFEFTYIDWTEGSKRLEALRGNQDKEGVKMLAHTFPSGTIEEMSAVTEIYIETTDSHTSVHTVHTYPNEDMMVFTESTLRI